jgi:hypothetical protein
MLKKIALSPYLSGGRDCHIAQTILPGNGPFEIKENLTIVKQLLRSNKDG